MARDTTLYDELLDRLPLQGPGVTLRILAREDLDLLAGWPDYVWPYEAFRFSFARFDKRERDVFFAHRLRQRDRIWFVADAQSLPAIGYISFIGIDWRQRNARNIGMRVHPDWCDRGIGTKILEMVQDWWSAAGMAGLRIDVAASNGRAVACYGKAGFRRVGEFWREAPELEDADLEDPKWSFLRGHIRREADGTQL